MYTETPYIKVRKQELNSALKMCHAHNEKWEKRNNRKNRTAKS